MILIQLKINVSEVSNSLNVCLLNYFQLPSGSNPERGRALGEDHKVSVCS